MTRFAPDGSVQSGLNPLARRGSCCCCCSLRSGVIVLAILLMIKSVILSVQWYYYSENAVHYYNDYDYSSDDGDVDHYHAYGHDEGDDVITIDDDSDYPDDEPPQQGGGEYSQGGQGQGQGQGQSQGGMGPEQGEGQGQGGPATDTMGPQQGGEMGEGGEMGQQPQQGGQGQGHGGPATDTIEIEEEDSTMPLEADTEVMESHYGDDEEVEEEEEVDIPVWFSILAWSCVAWHFIGGLLGMFAGCNYKKCCAFMFWMWWVITMTVSFALGVIVFYFAGFHWCLLAMFTVGMAIGIYFTVKVKQFYNLLRNDVQPRAPAGYSDINITAAV